MALEHTGTCMGRIAGEARESIRQRYANRGGSRTEVRRAVCELRWMDLTTCDVSESTEVVICQIHVREIIHFLYNGPKIRIRCSG